MAQSCRTVQGARELTGTQTCSELEIGKSQVASEDDTSDAVFVELKSGPQLEVLFSLGYYNVPFHHRLKVEVCVPVISLPRGLIPPPTVRVIFWDVPGVPEKIPAGAPPWSPQEGSTARGLALISTLMVLLAGTLKAPRRHPYN